MLNRINVLNFHEKNCKHEISPDIRKLIPAWKLLKCVDVAVKLLRYKYINYINCYHVRHSKNEPMNRLFSKFKKRVLKICPYIVSAFDCRSTTIKEARRWDGWTAGDFQVITTGGKYDWCFSCCLGGTIALEKRFLHSCFHGASFHLFKWLLPYLGYLPSVNFFLMEISFIVYYLRSRYIIVKYIEVLFRHLFALHMFWEFMFWMTFSVFSNQVRPLSRRAAF